MCAGMRSTSSSAFAWEQQQNTPVKHTRHRTHNSPTPSHLLQLLLQPRIVRPHLLRLSLQPLDLRPLDVVDFFQHKLVLVLLRARARCRLVCSSFAVDGGAG